MSKLVHFNVGMTCGGCSGAVSRILKKIEGVVEVETSIEEKTVLVKAEDGASEEAMIGECCFLNCIC